MIIISELTCCEKLYLLSDKKHYKWMNNIDFRSNILPHFILNDILGEDIIDENLVKFVLQNDCVVLPFTKRKLIECGFEKYIQ